jgi:hypothetical protein
MEGRPKVTKDLDPRGSSAPVRRAAWEPPTLVELPKLTELTLQSGPPIGGGGDTGNGGSTVF